MERPTDIQLFEAINALALTPGLCKPLLMAMWAHLAERHGVYDSFFVVVKWLTDMNEKHTTWWPSVQRNDLAALTQDDPDWLEELLAKLKGEDK